MCLQFKTNEGTDQHVRPFFLGEVYPEYFMHYIGPVGLNYYSTACINVPGIGGKVPSLGPTLRRHKDDNHLSMHFPKTIENCVTYVARRRSWLHYVVLYTYRVEGTNLV